MTVRVTDCTKLNQQSAKREWASRKRSVSKLLNTAAVTTAIVLLGACASTNSGNKSVLRDSIGATTNTEQTAASLDPVANAAFWGTRYDREPTNPKVAVTYSAALRKIGSRAESLKVISKTADLNPDNPHVLFEYGKTLIEDGRAFEAVRHLEFAQRQLPDSWQILSAYGVALDQIGEHDSAQEKYDLALSFAPNSVSVLNNKGLSYALSGNLALANRVLTNASGNLRANSRVRQNLALVSALGGDLSKAERLVRSDLPPQVANNNIAYYKNLFSQPAYWQDFSASEFDTPSFEDELDNELTSAPSAPIASEDLIPLEEFEAAPTPRIEDQFVQPVEPEVAPEVLEEPELNIAPEETDEEIGAPLVLGPVTTPLTASVETLTAEEFNAEEFDVETDLSLESDYVEDALEESASLEAVEESNFSDASSSNSNLLSLEEEFESLFGEDVSETQEVTSQTDFSDGIPQSLSLEEELNQLLQPVEDGGTN